MDPLVLLATGGGKPQVTYADDVFSAYTYTGTANTRTIATGINLLDNDGLIILKNRTSALANSWYDTVRGASKRLSSSSTVAEVTHGANIGLTAFTNSGFQLMSNYAGENSSNESIVAWTFRKAPKFFDVVTYTGTGVTRTVSHDLGVVPGMIVIKKLDGNSGFQVYHRSAGEDAYLLLNGNDAVTAGTTWNGTAPTSTRFTLNATTLYNQAGSSYVAYLFAHDESPNGLIQCGTYTGNGSTAGPTITLGWEPQLVLIKRTDSTGDWYLYDTARGMPDGSGDLSLKPNTTAAEVSGTVIDPMATGFQITTTVSDGNASGGTYLYMAIRRSNKPPTSGTSVFLPQLRTNSNPLTVTGVPFAPDAMIAKSRSSANNGLFTSRLAGARLMKPDATDAELHTGQAFTQSGFYWPDSNFNSMGGTSVDYFLKRAKGFFDVVCYKGTGAAATHQHGLGAVPELIITKNRTSIGPWACVLPAALGVSSVMYLNQTSSSASAPGLMGAGVTSTTFGVHAGGWNENNASGSDYVAYLFASLPGISKVGSYVGNGESLNVDCGFTGGARFVMIKAATATGDWRVFDTARGIVAGSDPYVAMNTTVAETSSDVIDPYPQGFSIGDNFLNTQNATYIYLAIA